MKLKALWCAVALMGCGPSTTPPAKVWTTREFVANAKNDKDFGQISTRLLAVAEGDPIPWRSKPFAVDDAIQAKGPALPLWPAFAEGRTATVLITEIWRDHPTPWVQPVYQFVTEDGKPATDFRGVFAVGVDSTFYTPYWRAELATVPSSATGDTFTSVTSILDARLAVRASVMVVCPIVPREVFVATADSDLSPVRPLSGEPVDAPGRAEAWVDGKVVTYLGVGFDRQTVTDDERPVETPIYFFTKSPGAGGKGFTLPPILPDAPARHSLHRRYDIGLPANAGVFVSANREALRARLKSEGATVPEVDAAIPEAVAKRYLLRVASDTSCFSSAALFPSGCTWLDSQTAVETIIGQDVRFRTEVLMTVSTLQLGLTR